MRCRTSTHSTSVVPDDESEIDAIVPAKTSCASSFELIAPCCRTCIQTPTHLPIHSRGVLETVGGAFTSDVFSVRGIA